MNIGQAKEQIKNAMQAYFSKDAFGEYCIPVERQRPIFLMGPPGVGKTAIMAQIASELNVALSPAMGRTSRGTPLRSMKSCSPACKAKMGRT